MEILIAAAAHWLHMHGWVLVETPADIDQAQWRMDNTNDPVRIADRIAWAESHSLWYAVSTLQNEPLATGGELPRRVAARCGLAPEPPQGARTDTAETTGATP